jgi:hypothetical protein
MTVEYMICWTAKNPKESIDRFLKSGHDLPPGVKIISSWHVVANPMGFVVVQGTLEAITQLTIAWADVLTLTSYPVMDDAGAKALLLKHAKWTWRGSGSKVSGPR